ncbi:MAG: AbiEi antitoxin N-terminal domain-containing protein, partial [Proteobacteria bacterium]|nr:AbiEi antitoxin N-terminal domain-containing protein [Pseudomonadota bacterium]
MTESTLASRTLKLASQRGVLRARDLAAEDIPPVILSRLVKSGHLTRLSRGVYARPTRRLSEHHQLAEVATRIPAGRVLSIADGEGRNGVHLAALGYAVT